MGENNLPLIWFVKVLTKMVSTNMVLTSLHKYGLDKHGLVKHGLDKHDLDKHGLDIVLTNLVLTTWSCQTWSRHGLSIMVLTNNLLAVLDCLSILFNNKAETNRAMYHHGNICVHALWKILTIFQIWVLMTCM